ncbi:hypothetical protein M9434_005469 [Picochlorum sp. BPE23]|jgi:hypothetical protein|nr:hypothetical protein M9434_005469 [Picochlorum sp. BPE23]KAI8103212.1 hypothetical protein M9435_004554 [Picochlorum sp. BPE23]|eukprot:jgi/Picre1/29592/NNA_004977.t1
MFARLNSAAPRLAVYHKVLKRPHQYSRVARTFSQKKNNVVELIEDNGNVIGSVGLFGLWGALLGYAVFLSPNQTPALDQYFLRKFLNLEDDGVSINTVFTSLFYVMGLWPLIYTSLLIPAGMRKGLPVFPFVALSYAIGAFGLLPWMALWGPSTSDDGGPPNMPPGGQDVEGFKNSITRGMESPITAWGILGGTLYCLWSAAVAGSGQWNDYLQLFSVSRFVHVTSIDFTTLCLLAPFWMENDAKLRRWEGKDTLLPILACFPVLGPALYLVLRPRSSES